MENETIENISGELMFTQKRYNKFKKDYNQAIEIIRQVKHSGREIIGFDLVEVGNADWDANVGARLLYEMACYF